MGFPRDFLRESQRDGMAGRRPAPRGERGGSLGSTHKIYITPIPLHLGERPLACHSIPPTFPQEIPRKTHTFPPLVNKNISLPIPFNDIWNECSHGLLCRSDQSMKLL